MSQSRQPSTIQFVAAAGLVVLLAIVATRDKPSNQNATEMETQEAEKTAYEVWYEKTPHSTNITLPSRATHSDARHTIQILTGETDVEWKEKTWVGGGGYERKPRLELETSHPQLQDVTSIAVKENEIDVRAYWKEDPKKHAEDLIPLLGELTLVGRELWKPRIVPVIEVEEIAQVNDFYVVTYSRK